MASLVARVSMSAQDTTPGQTFSSTSLIWSILSKPFKDLFGIACFSIAWFLFPLLSSKRTEASHPWFKKPTTLRTTDIADGNYKIHNVHNMVSLQKKSWRLNNVHILSIRLNTKYIRAHQATKRNPICKLGTHKIQNQLEVIIRKLLQLIQFYCKSSHTWFMRNIQCSIGLGIRSKLWTLLVSIQTSWTGNNVPYNWKRSLYSKWVPNRSQRASYWIQKVNQCLEEQPQTPI
jgi:hypothetical protein